MDPILVDKIIGNPLVTPMVQDGVSTTQMPVTDLHQHWDILMTGNVKLSGFTKMPTLYSEGPENLMAMISIIPAAKNPAGINEQFKMADAAYFRFRTLCESGVDVDRTVANPTTNATYGLKTTPRIYFSDPHLVDSNLKPIPDRTAFDTRHLSSLNLNIQWRDPSAVGYGGTGGTVALSTVQVVVKARTIQNISPMANDGSLRNRNYVREIQQIFSVPATQLGYVFQNLRSFAPLRRLYVKTTVGSTTFTEVSDTPLGSNTQRAEGPHIQFRVNQTDILKDEIYAQLQLDNRKDYGVVGPWLPGHIVYETSKNHRNDQFLDLRQYAAFDMVADTVVQTNATNTAQFTYQETGFTRKM